MDHTVKLSTLSAHLVTMFKLPMSDFTELQRALKDQSVHFDPDSAVNSAVLARAAEVNVGYDPDLFKGKTGPGGGIEVDSFRAAFFVLAVMLNGPRKESARATWNTWHLSQHGSLNIGVGDNAKPLFTTCAMTGAHLFGEALKAIIEDRVLASRVVEVRATSEFSGEIQFDSSKVSRFNRGDSVPPAFLRRVSIVTGPAWLAIADILRDGR